MFIQTRGSATKRFAKFGRQQAFCVKKKRKRRLAQPSQTGYNLMVKHVNVSLLSWEKQVPSLVDRKRMYLALVSDFVCWDPASLVPRHKITHLCKIPPLSIHS